MPFGKNFGKLPLKKAAYLCLSLLMAVIGLALAFNAAPVAQAQTGGATINVFCLDFGKDFPTGQTIQAKGLALDKVRGGLAYALAKGYVTSNPYQVQLAMWHLQDNQPYHDLKNEGTTIAEEISNNAGTVPNGDASTLNNITLTGIKETSLQSAYGTATIQGNVDTKGLPVGFLLPASGSNFQNLVAVVVAGAPTPTPTPQAVQGQIQGSAPSSVPSTGNGGAGQTGTSDAEAFSRTIWLAGSIVGVVLMSLGLSWGLKLIGRTRRR